MSNLKNQKKIFLVMKYMGFIWKNNPKLREAWTFEGKPDFKVYWNAVKEDVENTLSAGGSIGFDKYFTMYKFHDPQEKPILPKKDISFNDAISCEEFDRRHNERRRVEKIWEEIPSTIKARSVEDIYYDYQKERLQGFNYLSKAAGLQRAQEEAWLKSYARKQIEVGE